MTANVLPEQIEAYSAAGTDAHIGKPFRCDQMLSTVSLLLPATGAAESASYPGLDRTTFQATKQALSPPRLREILGIFLTGLESSCEEGKIEREGIEAYVAKITEVRNLSVNIREPAENMKP